MRGVLPSLFRALTLAPFHQNRHSLMSCKTHLYILTCECVCVWVACQTSQEALLMARSRLAMLTEYWQASRAWRHKLRGCQCYMLPCHWSPGKGSHLQSGSLPSEFHLEDKASSAGAQGLPNGCQKGSNSPLRRHVTACWVPFKILCGHSPDAHCRNLASFRGQGYPAWIRQATSNRPALRS